jgi:hypothetical protein
MRCHEEFLTGADFPPGKRVERPIQPILQSVLTDLSF